LHFLTRQDLPPLTPPHFHCFAQQPPDIFYHAAVFDFIIATSYRFYRFSPFSEAYFLFFVDTFSGIT